MPEGHAIHRLARLIRDGFAGQVVVASSPQGRFRDGAALLDGSRLVSSDAVGKHLFVGFACGSEANEMRWLHVHLGLYGRWHFAYNETADEVWQPPPVRGQVRLRLVTTTGVADLVGPNQCAVITTEERAALEVRLGPDPLNPDPDGAAEADVVRRIRSRSVPVGALLMDQSVVAGIGNIYRAEVLYLARVHPRRPGSSLAPATVRTIWRHTVELMTAGERAGRIVTTDPLDRVGPEDTRYVYDRAGQPCLRCGAQIRVEDLAGRKVFWCPREQRARM